MLKAKNTKEDVSNVYGSQKYTMLKVKNTKRRCFKYLWFTKVHTVEGKEFKKKMFDTSMHVFTKLVSIQIKDRKVSIPVTVHSTTGE